MNKYGFKSTKRNLECYPNIRVIYLQQSKCCNILSNNQRCKTQIYLIAFILIYFYIMTRKIKFTDISEIFQNIV